MTPDHADVLVDAVRVRELMAVLGELETVGATPVVFKGAALAHTHYQDSWSRPRLDADLLIAPDSRQRVFARLSELGYERPPLVSGDLVMYQAPFARIDRLGIEHALDIHWRIVNPQVVSKALTHDEVVMRSVRVDVEGRAMRVPSDVDSLLLACIHRVAHHGDSEDPIWLYDIHLLATRFQHAEWRDFVDRASRQSVRAICARGLSLAGGRYQTPLPSSVMAELTASGPSEPSAVFLRQDLRPFDGLISDLRALGPLDAARLVGEHLFPPADYMDAAYGVRHRALLPVYYAARAIGGVSKWFRQASATRYLFP